MLGYSIVWAKPVVMARWVREELGVWIERQESIYLGHLTFKIRQ